MAEIMLSRTNVLLICVAVILVCTHSQASSGPTPRYSSKTGYDTSFEPGTDEASYQRSRDWRTIASDVGETALVEGCQPVGVYALHRHGMRYASDGDIETYNGFLARMKETGVSAEFAYLLNITDNLYPIALEGELHPAGLAEMAGLGSRMRMRLPELFDQGTDFDGFTFQGTYRQRTIDSARGYVSGLLGGGSVCNITSKSNTKDTVTCNVDESAGETETVVIDHGQEGEVDILLKFYESCTNYITSVDDNDTAVIENAKFRDGPELTAVFEAMATKLAPSTSPEPWNMTKDELETMHHMCGYETGYYGSSPWCDLFSNNESLAVEYWLDLDQYWAESYGHDINYEMACPLVDDIASYMDSVKMSEKEAPKGSFKFAHSSTIQPLLAILGLYRDSPMLLADNYAESVDRVWRTGRIAPMSSHLAFNVFQCTGDDDDDDDSGDEFRALVLHNELPIKIGDCENFFCTYDEVVSHLKSSTGDCRWDNLCGTNGVYPGRLSNAGGALSSAPWVITLVSSLFILFYSRSIM